MGDIKQLPEAVHSSVRSGIILFDLARVVEELIFNSLDAGATKVHISQCHCMLHKWFIYVQLVYVTSIETYIHVHVSICKS